MVAGIVNGTLPLAVPVVYRQVGYEVSEAPGTNRPIQSVAVGAEMPLQAAVTLPPATMLDGVTLKLACGGVVTVNVLLFPMRVYVKFVNSRSS